MLGMMAQSTADDRHGDTLVPGNAGPGMTCHIGGERHVEPQTGAQLLEAEVDLMGGAEILVAVVARDVADDGEQVGSVGRVVLVDNVLHGALPPDGQELAGLVAVVGKETAAQVFLLQVGHVDKRHATGVEAEHEEVAGIVETGIETEVQVADAADDLQGDGTLDRAVDAGIDTAEGIALDCQAVFDGTVVDGAQVAHVVGRGVGTDALAAQVAFVGRHEVGVYLVQRHVDIVAETHEAVERRKVGLGRAATVRKTQTADQAQRIVPEAFGKRRPLPDPGRGRMDF